MSPQANRLAQEKSPYLLQHAHNPVDWYPWGDEAFAKAKAEDKPIFLSVGYSTCHWCHVMERESFESAAIAQLLNAHFVAIKVDREERPDVDAVYMEAVQSLTGQGGWPMSVFMTPEKQPFYGGTYFPPDDRYGRPGFARLLNELHKAWQTRRSEVLTSADSIAKHLQGMRRAPRSDELPTEAILKAGYVAEARSFDEAYGGFGTAPKFPSPHRVRFLMRYYARSQDAQALAMVTKTLDAMADGGLYDQLGGGFARYSTDQFWLVPHFEKMLYDNAGLTQAYLEAYQLTGNERYANVARETLDYVLREMTSPEGGFYSAEDADSEGVEGKYYIWTPPEVAAILGESEAETFNAFYGVTAKGNFEHGWSILNRTMPLSQLAERLGVSETEAERFLAESRAKLLAVRDGRIHPHLDDKVLAAWNGMMISAMAQAYQVLGDTRYRDAAVRAGELITGTLMPEGELLRRLRDGEAAIPAFQEDYAWVIQGLIDLYETTFALKWIETARQLMQQMIDRFWDDADPGFFLAGRHHEQLVSRPKEHYDGATASGNSVALLDMLRLAELSDDEALRERAALMIRRHRRSLEAQPAAFMAFLSAVDFFLSPVKAIVIAGDPTATDTQALIRTAWQRFRPNTVIALADGDQAAELMPILKHREPQDGKAVAFVCEGQTCHLPTSDAAVLAKELAGAGI